MRTTSANAEGDMRWGISCEVTGDMDALGSILAMMKVKGAREIGFEPLPDVEHLPPHSPPLALPAPARHPNTFRGVVDSYVRAKAAGDEFRMSEVVEAISAAGYAKRYVPLDEWIEAGFLTRVGHGHFRRTRRRAAS